MTSLAIIDAPLSLDELNVASPCPANWDEMKGGDSVRFCSSCKKNVYNLSALGREEAIALVNELEPEGFCGRFYRRADGTMLTADCPVGLKEKARRASRRAVAASLYLVTMLLFAATSFFLGRSFQDASCDATNVSTRTVDKVFGPPVIELVEPDVEMGEAATVKEPIQRQPLGRMVKGDVAYPESVD